MPTVIVEGVDRVGKSTVADHLSSEHGFSYMHFSRPRGTTPSEKAHFQWGTFDRMFQFLRALEGQPARIVMDRGHLGELVYGPIYRGDSGVDLTYIHDLEQIWLGDVILVLMVHRNLDVLRRRDDGLGFDITKLEAEQALFEEAWSRSRLPRKHLLDVTDMSILDVYAFMDTLIKDVK